jgi:outer membrane immunogenic protein
MRRFLGRSFASLISIGFAGLGAASAADMPVKAPAYKAPPVVVYNWTGFYVGGNIGAIGSSGNAVHQCYNGAGVFNGVGCDIVPDAGLNGTGVIGGVQAGYNWQKNNWLFGLEGDAQGTSLKSSSSNTNTFPVVGGGADPLVTYTFVSRLDWLATLRGRVGVTSGAALFYVTGGGAFGGIRTATNGVGPINAFPSTASSNQAGWTAGGGVEWGFAPQWSAKAEGLYYDLGRVTSLGASLPPINTFMQGARYEVNGWIARVGVNYHFGGPVVAKY